MDKFHKQIWEEFEITADFSPVMASSEVLRSESTEVKACDKNNNDKSTAILGTKTCQAQKITVLIKAGLEIESPYKITFKTETNSSNKWELDVRCNVKNI